MSWVFPVPAPVKDRDGMDMEQLTHFFSPHDLDLKLPLHVFALFFVLFHLLFGLPHFLLEDIQDVGTLHGGHFEGF